MSCFPFVKICLRKQLCWCLWFGIPCLFCPSAPCLLRTLTSVSSGNRDPLMSYWPMETPADGQERKELEMRAIISPSLSKSPQARSIPEDLLSVTFLFLVLVITEQCFSPAGPGFLQHPGAHWSNFVNTTFLILTWL